MSDVAPYFLSAHLLVGEWLSLVEHLVRDQGVGGSNPLSPTKFFKINTYTLKGYAHVIHLPDHDMADLILHEENWLPLIRSLGIFTTVTSAVRG